MGEDRAKRCSYEEQAEARLRELLSGIEGLRIRLATASGEVRAAATRMLEDVLGMVLNARQRLDYLRRAADSAWHELRGQLDAAFEALSRRYRAVSTVVYSVREPGGYPQAAM